MENNNLVVLKDFSQIITSFKNDLLAVLPDLISAIVILFIGLIVAYFIKWFSAKFIKWIVDILPSSIREKDFVKESLAHLVLGSSKILFYLTIFFAVYLSMKKLGMEVLSTWFENLGKYLPNIVSALVIIVLGWKAKNYIEVAVDKAMNKSGIPNTLLVSRLVSWSIFIISALVSLQQIGLDISLIVMLSTVVIGLAIFGVVLMVSLGAKDTVSDILYCYQLNKFLKVGYSVQLKNFNGEIKSIGPVFVILESKDGHITIPGKLFSQDILCFSQKGDN